MPDTAHYDAIDGKDKVLCPVAWCSGPTASDVTGTLYCAKCGRKIDGFDFEARIAELESKMDDILPDLN